MVVTAAFVLEYRYLYVSVIAAFVTTYVPAAADDDDAVSTDR